ncbi:hypothetical protein NEHOM01_1583 [Nematocida homosporus]|uniref:uncharacterized protein n=1 Tax=Nematocida homosporus TaxID=1912981 RepID=UPI00221FCFBA|nr:uncharacterized protein NEHOM01_1583 [Nematocida homosporus]KAI5186615.1 hypothetical protein NEHOM01_1583 [Nematocida homosporus]
MTDKNGWWFVRKNGFLLHAVLIVAAFVAVIYNIRMLHTRREIVKSEIVGLFKKEYIKHMLHEVNLHENVPRLVVDKDLSMLLPPKMNFGLGSSDRDDNKSFANAPKEYDLLMDRLLHDKIKNPFLFGFQNLPNQTIQVIAQTFFKEGSVNTLKGEGVLQTKIDKFFAGTLPDAAYASVCDVFALLTLRLAPQYVADETNIMWSTNQGDVLEISSTEYLVIVALVGEIGTATLGIRVPAAEFIKELGGDPAVLKTSVFLKAVNHRQTHFPLPA